MKIKSKRESALRIPMEFDDAIKLAIKVKPPAEGWAAHEASLKAKRQRKPNAPRRKKARA